MAETGATISETATRAVAQVVGGAVQATGTFRFRFADQRWVWSDEVAAMHGYEPGSVTPTTELLLSHKHPDDRAHVADAIVKSVCDAEPFCSRHRILDTEGRTRLVIVFGDTMTEGGEVVGVTGYYVDLTDIMDEQRQEMLTGVLAELTAARAVIEQAKGVLMRVYRLDAEQAFRVLQWRSQDTNVKLRTLATRLIAELDALPPASPQVQTAFDHLLLTVHERAD